MQCIAQLERQAELGSKNTLSQARGLGDLSLNAFILSDGLHDNRLIIFAVEGHPASGTPPEALSYHRLEEKSLVDWILNAIA